MSTALAAEKSVVNVIRAALGISGVLSAVVGILILVWPGKTAMVVTGIVAVYAIVAGLIYAALGVFSRTQAGWSRVGHIALGILFVVAGIVAFLNLRAATESLAIFVGVLVGVLWIVEGVVALSTLSEATSRGWTVVFAIVSIAAGIVLLFAPLYIAALWWLLGLSLIVLGLAQIIRAFTFGNADR